MSFQTDVNGVRDTACGLSGADPADAYMARVTDELVIEGNGYSITGGSRWITPDGFSNVIGLCPADKDVQGTIVSNPVGLVALEDNVKVTVNDLQLKSLRAIAALRADTDLTLNRVTAQRTIDFYRFCDTGAIFLVSGENQNVTINDSVFEEAWNDGLVVQGRPDGNQFWGNAFIAGFSSAGTLSISNSWFGNFAGIPVIDWDGAVNIETTEFKDTGFMNIRGGTATIVNSLIMGDAAGQGPHQRIMASDGGSITLEASTIAVSLLDCQTVCQSTTGPGLIIATNNASIELKASAISVGIPDIPDVLIREATGGNVTATAAPNPNWVQPVTPQDAAALKAILDQPALLTDAPGLPNKFAAAFFYEAATPLADDGGGTPGLLIDAVTGADSGNELLSPIDGVSPITEDIFGNPRTEAAGTVRNIGAVQLGLAPTLHLTATGDALVDLNWTRPTDPGSGAITSYEVCFGTGTVPDPSALGSDCEDGGGNPGTVQTISNAPDNLTGQVTALVNGEIYWFLLRGANAVGGGPWSNPVIGTPYGVIGTPSLTVTSTSCSAVLLEWTQPDLGGHTFAGYTVSWGLGGSGTATGTILIPDYNTLSTTISGLNCNTNYSFAVTASSVDGSAGSSGTGTVLTPPASPVPALGMLGSILLALVMLGIGMAGVRRFH